MTFTNASTRRAFLQRSLLLAAGIATADVLAACTGSSDKAGRAATPKTTRTSSGPKDASAVAVDAFYAGLPLLTTMRTMQTFALLFGENRLFVTPGLVKPTSHLVVAPNHDTVYALGVLDLRGGPLALAVPAIDRYHVVQFIDAWMGNFGLVGTRTTGNRAASYVVVPPQYTGPIPTGAHRLECPTAQAIMLARIRAVDDNDAVRAAALGRQLRLTPVARAGGAPPVPAMPAPRGTPQSVGSDGAAFFDELGDALAVNGPVTREQRAAIATARVLGIGAGLHPTSDGGAHTAELQTAVTTGLRELARKSVAGSREVNGWAVNLGLGEESTNGGLEQRAVIAKYFWGPVPAAEAVYPHALHASDGQPLNGDKRYRIRFARGELPPVDGFWSVTVYGPDQFLVPNAAGRYSISGDTPGLRTNADGSLDVLLQHDAPVGHESNWLPVPKGPFSLNMRLYLPRAPILDGTYPYPPITVTT